MPRMSNNEYYEKFKMEHINAILADIAIDPDVPTEAKTEHARSMAWDQYLAVAFL